jgi:hypothetical protein
VFRVSLVLLAACATTPAPAPRPPPPPVQTPARIDFTATSCIDVAATRARLEQVLAQHRATFADLNVRVDATPSAETTEVRVVVTRRAGDAGLDRSYTLGPSDCASAIDLVALGVDRFLDAFPDWATSAPPPPPVAIATAPPSRWFDLTLLGAANAIMAPIGVDAHVGAGLDLGTAQHRGGATLLVRASVPQAAGDGRFQQTAVLAGASYRFLRNGWRLRVEARAGALLVSGMGLDENRSDWLPWWEGAAFVGYGFSWGALGLELAGTALRDKAVTSDGLIEEDIPSFRLGLAAEFGLWSSNR